MKKFALGQKVSSSRLKLVAVAIAGLLILAGISGGGAYVWYAVNLKPRDASATTLQLITIRQGLSADGIADLLEDKDIIRSSSAFTWYTSRQGVKDQLKAGTYELGPQLSVSEIVDKLFRGDIAKRTVTFVPGRRLDQLRAAMIEAGYDETAVQTALDTIGRKTLAGILPEGASLEGYLYAETYILPLESGPEAVVAQATAEFVEQLTPEFKAGIEVQGLTIHQAVTLASIIQQESSNPEVQQQIAQVFLRRLDLGMRLQADPTFRYGAALSGATASSSLNHPYNTYRIAGLPPGPIGNFNGSALKAVANPAEGDYLYFVAGDDGVTRFSRTLSEHEALKAQYCIELCRL